ncbi:MAG: Nucleotide sugar dehydrogenase [Parcubacteria group bacterium GW2011_GWA2_40_23]|nr:MAG: Nucleotide sugar dehydrogenase [Parcubacteria group bacterium GW2011_GWA2_40_23]
MKILIIGTGYVGLVSGTCYAELGHEVVCVDNDSTKIEKLSRGEVPFFEQGLADLISKNKTAGRLQFKLSLKDDVNSSDIIFIAVGTPSKENGQADLKYVFEVAKEIGQNLQNYNVIVTKSTVPIGTSKKIRRIISKYYTGAFDVALKNLLVQRLKQLFLHQN